MNSNSALAYCLLWACYPFDCKVSSISNVPEAHLVAPSCSWSLPVSIFSVTFHCDFCTLHNIIVYCLNTFILKTKVMYCSLNTYVCVVSIKHVYWWFLIVTSHLPGLYFKWWTLIIVTTWMSPHPLMSSYTYCSHTHRNHTTVITILRIMILCKD